MTWRIRISSLLESKSRTYLSRVTLEFRELREIVRREIKLPNRAFSETLVKRLWFAIDVDDDGTITRAIPISRVRASRDSLTSPTPPGPQSVGPFAHLCQGARA